MKFGIHSEQYQNNYSKEEEQKFTQTFSELTSEFAAKMTEGIQASDASVQELVKKTFRLYPSVLDSEQGSLQISCDDIYLAFALQR